MYILRLFIHSMQFTVKLLQIGMITRLRTILSETAKVCPTESATSSSCITRLVRPFREQLLSPPLRNGWKVFFFSFSRFKVQWGCTIQRGGMGAHGREQTRVGEDTTMERVAPERSQ